MPSIKTAPVSSTTQLIEAVAFETQLGWIAIAAADDKLTRVLFGRTEFEDFVAQLHKEGLALVDNADELTDWAPELCERLREFAEGEQVDFSDVPIDLDHLTPFARKVVKACRKLAWGETATYAELARRAGRSGAARAVGNVMANNRHPLVVPCHRVVGSGGGLGGYSAPGGLATKRRLLDMESE